MPVLAGRFDGSPQMLLSAILQPHSFGLPEDRISDTLDYLLALCEPHTQLYFFSSARTPSKPLSRYRQHTLSSPCDLQHLRIHHRELHLARYEW